MHPFAIGDYIIFARGVDIGVIHPFDELLADGDSFLFGAGQPSVAQSSEHLNGAGPNTVPAG